MLLGATAISSYKKRHPDDKITHLFIQHDLFTCIIHLTTRMCTKIPVGSVEMSVAFCPQVITVDGLTSLTGPL